MESLHNDPKNQNTNCKDGVCSLPTPEEKKAPNVVCDGDTCRIVAPEEATTEAPIVELDDLL